MFSLHLTLHESQIECTTSILRHFFFKETATTEIYTLSLHDALPIRSPPSSSRCPSAKPITSARSSLVSETSGEANSMEGERSGQIHTVWAASHSRSRT